MTDEIKKMLEPFQRSFTLRGDPCDKSSWTWDVQPPPEAFWDDDIYVPREEFDRLKRGFEEYDRLYINAIKLVDKLSRQLNPENQTKTVEDVLAIAYAKLETAMKENKP